MKKLVFAVCTLLFLGFSVYAQAVYETGEANDRVRLGVMQGPTAFSAVMIDSSVAELSVFPSPADALARITKGELDMAVLPANAALSLYNRGAGIKALAIVGEGMLSLVGTSGHGKTVSVPGAGGTPDHMARLLFPEYIPDYSVTAPAQLAQLLIAGKCTLALLPQPFVTMVLSANHDVEILADVDAGWKALTGLDRYPMSILVVSAEYAGKNPVGVMRLCNAYKLSVKKVNGNPVAAGERINALLGMDAKVAAKAVPQCALVYIDGEQAKSEAAAYFDVLMNLDSGAIGGKTVSDGFWY